jgi:hypothetical protein
MIKRYINFILLLFVAFSLFILHARSTMFEISIYFFVFLFFLDFADIIVNSP